MARIDGLSISVTATPAQFTVGNITRIYTVVNDGSDAVYIRSVEDIDHAVGPSGNDSTLLAARCAKLNQNDQLAIDPPVLTMWIVCAGSGTATVRVLPGALHEK